MNTCIILFFIILLVEFSNICDNYKMSQSREFTFTTINKSLTIQPLPQIKTNNIWHKYKHMYIFNFTFHDIIV
jgi:hypothetical protein